jgi:hypothetical protein
MKWQLVQFKFKNNSSTLSSLIVLCKAGSRSFEFEAEGKKEGDGRIRSQPSSQSAFLQIPERKIIFDLNRRSLLLLLSFPVLTCMPLAITIPLFLLSFLCLEFYAPLSGTG